MIISVLGVLVVLLVIFGIAEKSGRKTPPSEIIGEEVVVPAKTGETVIPEYIPEIPEEVEVTIPVNEAPASLNPNLDTKMRFYEMRATKDGFEPSSLAVEGGDTVQIKFTAVDGDYDIDFPYLGVYFNVVRKGETKTLPFDTSLSGTFGFLCRDYCPDSGKIEGKLIVIPR